MDLTGPFLAGFVAGEAHFSIRPNNAGQSWSCGFQLVQRDDNLELVAAVRSLAGCGALRWKPARGSSHPQVLWQTVTIEDCATLAGALTGLHLLGTKAGEFAIWQRAVAVWSRGRSASSRWRELEQCVAALHAHRQFGLPADYTRVDASEGYLAGFLAGFSSAEGHFGAATSGHPCFVIKLRADDSAVLALLHARFAMGRLVVTPSSLYGHAQTAWLVTRLEELRRLVAVFDRNPPQGRAQRIYRHWRELVLAQDRRAPILRPLARQIRLTRRYRPHSDLATMSTDSHAIKRNCYVAVLQSWARDTGRPHTATSYEGWRRVERGRGPTRNTLARFFGSWRAALEAAALPAEGCRPADTISKCLDTRAATRVVAAGQRRMAVLEAVERCWVALGRVPGASEFFRWRLHSATDCPSQADIYRLFPGGWPDVLGALPPQGGTLSR